MLKKPELTRFVIRALCQLLPTARRTRVRGLVGDDTCPECRATVVVRDTQDHFVSCAHGGHESMVAAAARAIAQSLDANVRDQDVRTAIMTRLMAVPIAEQARIVVGAWPKAVVDTLPVSVSEYVSEWAQNGVAAAMEAYGMKLRRRGAAEREERVLQDARVEPEAQEAAQGALAAGDAVTVVTQSPTP